MATHLQLNPVELIEAGPRPSLSQAFEELAHGLVVQPVRAVEHHTLLGYCLGKVLQGEGRGGEG